MKSIFKDGIEKINAQQKHAKDVVVTKAKKAMHTTIDTALSRSAVKDIERLAQKKGKNTVEERFKVQPDYAYPNTRYNRDELRIEMNKRSTYFHDYTQRGADRQNQPTAPSSDRTSPQVGQIAVEVLQCFGIPKPDLYGETSAFCVLVCGSQAFKTDVMPPVANPMWLCKMRRAVLFPLHHAYDRVYIGVFGQSKSTHDKDGFAGRVVVDVSRLRPNCTYDVTLPLRMSTHVYSKTQRGAIRFRFHLSWYSEQKAMLSYLPKKMPKFSEPDERITVNCCDNKAFQNVARVVYGVDMPGKFSVKLVKATIREINFTRIHVLRYLRKRQVKELRQWNYPIISGFVFGAWMHSVYVDSIRYIPGHVITYLLLHLWKNYAYYALDSPVQNGFLAPSWEEMVMALIYGNKTGNNGVGCIEPLEMEMKDPSTAKSATQDMASTESIRSAAPDDGQSIRDSFTLQEIADDFRKRVQTETHRHRTAFRGKKAVDFLVENEYATTRAEAVEIGRRLCKEIKLFGCTTHRSSHFHDDNLWYVFLATDMNEYTMKTHKPRGKTLFRWVGLLPDTYPAEEELHMEMPYAAGGDHPRFTVKESLVIRSRESQKLLSEETVSDEPSKLVRDSEQKSELAKGLNQMLEEEEEEINHGDDEGSDNDEGDFESSRPSDSLITSRFVSPSHMERGTDSARGSTSNNNYIDPAKYEVKILKKPPSQNIDVVKKGEKKIVDVLAEVRHKVHGVLLHRFNDRVYKLPSAIHRGSVPNLSTDVRTSRFSKIKNSLRRSSNRSSGSAANVSTASGGRTSEILSAHFVIDENNRLLGAGKYSHGNPWIAKLGMIVQPIVEIAQAWLCLFRSLFNLFTWRDPILSFWCSVLGPILVLVLHFFPWRIIMTIVGILFVGPQNWLFRVLKERREGYQPDDFDMLIKKKKVQPPEDISSLDLFSSITHDNRPVDKSQLDSSTMKRVVIPQSPLMYQRFYDWPPENAYARVVAEDAPTNEGVSVPAIQQQQQEEEECSPHQSHRGVFHSRSSNASSASSVTSRTSTFQRLSGNVGVRRRQRRKRGSHETH